MTESNKNSENYSVLNSLLSRIDNTKRTDPESFEKASSYITAAWDLLGRSDADDKYKVLTVQILAYKLAEVVPGLINEANFETELVTAKDNLIKQ